METIHIDEDFLIMYVAAKEFPADICNAHEALHKQVPIEAGRKFISISRPENGIIQYKAGAVAKDASEAKQLGLPCIRIPKGDFIAITIKNYNDHIESIAAAFETLLEQPGLDSNSYCCEWYINPDDIICMVRKAG